MSLTNEEMNKVRSASMHSMTAMTSLVTAMDINQVLMKSKGANDISNAYGKVSSLLRMAVAILTDTGGEVTKRLDDAQSLVFMFHAEDMMFITNECVSKILDTLMDKQKVNLEKPGDLRKEIIEQYSIYLDFVIPWMAKMDKMHKASVEAIERYDKDHGGNG